MVLTVLPWVSPCLPSSWLVNFIKLKLQSTMENFKFSACWYQPSMMLHTTTSIQPVKNQNWQVLHLFVIMIWYIFDQCWFGVLLWTNFCKSWCNFHRKQASCFLVCCAPVNYYNYKLEIHVINKILWQLPLWSQFNVALLGKGRSHSYVSTAPYTFNANNEWLSVLFLVVDRVSLSNEQ